MFQLGVFIIRSTNKHRECFNMLNLLNKNSSAKRFWVAFVSIAVLGQMKAVGADNPFDPAAFIESKEATKPDEGGIISTGVYRINGVRFFQFVAADGEVFLPAIGDRAEIRDEAAVCRQHLPLKREALMIRDKLKPEPWVKDSEAKIFTLILKCIDGEIAGPTVTIEKKDGSTVEVKAKDPKTKSHETKVNRN